MTTTYLARLTLNPRNRQVAADLRDADKMHKRICTLYPDIPNLSVRSAYNLLYRLENSEGGPVLLVQSTSVPINHQALPPAYAQADCRDITPLLEGLVNGMQVHYRIDAAPETTVKSPDRIREIGARRAAARNLNPNQTEALIKELLDSSSKRGIRQRLTGEEAVQWWVQRAQKNGLSPTTVLESPQIQAVARRTDGQQATRYSLTRFQGTADITNAEQLRSAITQGIGRGRSYGAALLSIAPNRSQE